MISSSEKTSAEKGQTIICQGQDEFGPFSIVDRDDQRILQFGTPDPQSIMSLKDPYRLALEYTRLSMMALLFNPHPLSVLVLGLGGGSIPKFLWKHFPKCHFDIVERSKVVVDTCYEYFALPKSSRIKIHLKDAFDFIRNAENRYDFIFVDLFQKEGISTLVSEPDFFKDCKKLLKNKNSIVIWNTWKSMAPERMLESLQHIKESFGENVLILPDNQKENYIVLGFSKEITDNDLYKTVQRARLLEEKTHLNFLDMLADRNFLKDSRITDFARG